VTSASRPSSRVGKRPMSSLKSSAACSRSLICTAAVLLLAPPSWLSTRGPTKPASSPMMARTTRISTRVKPRD